MSNNSETYSNSPLGESQEKSKRTYFGMILFIVHLALTISLAVALIISYLTPYISPESFGSLTIVGHFAPILFVGVLVSLLIWLIAREWKVAGAVAIVLIPGLFYFSQFYNINFSAVATRIISTPSRCSRTTCVASTPTMAHARWVTMPSL